MIFPWQRILGQLRGEKNLRKPIVNKTLKYPPSYQLLQPVLHL